MSESFGNTNKGVDNPNRDSAWDRLSGEKREQINEEIERRMSRINENVYDKEKKIDREVDERVRKINENVYGVQEEATQEDLGETKTEVGAAPEVETKISEMPEVPKAEKSRRAEEIKSRVPEVEVVSEAEETLTNLKTPKYSVPTTVWCSCPEISIPSCP